MRIRELVKRLDVENLAPFHFVKKSDANEFAICKYLTDEELNDYLNEVWTSEKVYDDSELGIYIADVTIDELYELEKRRNPIALDRAISDISFIFPVKHDEFRIVFGIFVILHEIGHWVDFRESGKTSLEYALWDSSFRREPSELAKKIYKMPDYMYEKRQLAKIQVDMYKNIPSEKAADDYAFKNIKEKLELVRTYM